MCGRFGLYPARLVLSSGAGGGGELSSFPSGEAQAWQAPHVCGSCSPCRRLGVEQRRGWRSAAPRRAMSRQCRSPNECGRSGLSPALLVRSIGGEGVRPLPSR